MKLHNASLLSSIIIAFMICSSASLPTTSLRHSPSVQAQSVKNLERRYTILADGGDFISGSITDELLWQSSGIFAHGGCNSGAGINDCFSLFENFTGMLETAAPTPVSAIAEWVTTAASNMQIAMHNDEDLDAYFAAFPSQLSSLNPNHILSNASDILGEANADNSRKRQVVSDCSAISRKRNNVLATLSPRQRIELFSWPGALAGDTWKYSWKSFLDTGVSSSIHFFHLFQIFRRDACGGPVITLDAREGNAVIIDLVRGCDSCSSIPLSQWEGKTIQNSLQITYGISGSFKYSAVDASDPGTILLSYSAKGDMGSSASLKFGLYRAFTDSMSNARAFVGDYTAQKL